MIHGSKALLRTLLVCLCALGALATSVQAKTVAILFDTSGSMDSRYKLPSFGARMLAATMDGRAGFDRLLIMNFNEYAANLGATIPGVDASMQSGSAPDINEIVRRLPNAIRDVSVSSGAAHQALMAQLETEFRFRSSTGTPYGPIEVMLHRIAQDIEPGEEAVFVLVTDGAYTPSELFENGALVSTMRSAFEKVRDQITEKGASISVQYLFIDQRGGSELRQIVQSQGVRDTLLEVFNGSATAGSKYVSSENELWEGLQDIIAEVSGTDRAAQSSFINYQGNTIRLNTPLSISRVVIVSTGQVGSVPARQSDTFGETPTETRQVTTKMSGSDAAFGNPPPREGLIEHLYFQRAVPPGDYELTFDAPVDKDVFLLFETRALNKLAIFDSNGREIQPDASGEYRLFIGQQYEFRSQILDGDPAPVPVDFATLPPNLTMSLTLSDARGPSTASMQLDDTTDTGTFTYNPTTQGDLTASSRASAGVLSPRSETLRIVVMDSTASLTVSPVTPVLPCPSCTGDELNVPLDAGGGAPIGSVEIEAIAELDGQITLEGTDLPPGTELRDENGAVVPLDQPIDFGAGTTRTFTLWRTENATPEDLAQGLDQIIIQATPTGKWGGSSSTVTAQPKVEAPDLLMTLSDVTQPITPGAIDGLDVPAGELLRGQFAAQYSLVDLLQAPEADKINDLVTVSSVGSMSSLVTLEPHFPNAAATGFHALEIRPKTSFWCLCWIWGANTVRGSDIRDITVTYDFTVSGVSLQRAELTTPFRYSVPFVPTAGLSCALNLLYAILTYIFLRGVWALFTTHRFPKRSVVEITRGNAAPSYKRLDKGNSYWWKAWFAAFIGNPDETRTIEGLRIRATHKGAIVDIRKSVPPWRLERMDASFQELKENQPKKTEHRLIWGDRLDSTFDPTLSMRLKRKSGD